MSSVSSGYRIEAANTVINIGEQNEAFRMGFSQLLQGLMRSREIRWMGSLGYVGLNEAMDTRLANVIPEGCEEFPRGCQAEVSFSSRNNYCVPEDSSITITCRGGFVSNFPEGEIESGRALERVREMEAERHKNCGACHQRMRGKIIDTFTVLPVLLVDADEEIARTEDALVAARSAKTDIFNLSGLALD